MNQLQESSVGSIDEPGSVVLRSWRRLPLTARAILSGLFVFFVIQAGWPTFFFANLQFLPEVPWNVPLGALYLWVFFRYFRGRWWPASTAAARESAIRARMPSSSQWAWGLGFGAVLFLFMIAFINVFYRFMSIPEDNWDLSALPWWTLYPSLVMLSINAGVSEEAGFRGYMQGGLERRYHPAVAIGITSVVFWLLHLNHASGAARFALLILMGAGLGTLAYCARSIWPAIVTHATIDTIAFISMFGPRFRYLEQPSPIAETGFDISFFVFCSILLATIGVGVWVLRRLSALDRST